MDVEVHRWYQPECYECAWVGDVWEDPAQAEKEAEAHDCGDNPRAWIIAKNQNGDPLKRHEYVAVLNRYGEGERHFVLTEVALSEGVS